MNIVSPTHEGLAQSTKYMLWWVRMYNTACSIAVQIMPYARVRQLVKLDILTKPMEEGESFTAFQRNSPTAEHASPLLGAVQILVPSLVDAIDVPLHVTRYCNV